jgi:hypothetical protein
MLQDFERGGRIVPHVPYYADYLQKLNLLTAQEVIDLEAYADAEIAKAATSKKKICCSSWMCPSDWHLTPLEPIYTTIAKRSPTQAGMFWGLVVQDRVLTRAALNNEHWGMIHTDHPGAKGLTYWIM